MKFYTNKQAKYLLAIVVALATPSQGMAQSLEETVRTAVGSHPVVQGSEAAYRGTLHGVREAEAGYYPSIDLSADEGRTWTMDPSGGSATEDNMRQSGSLKLSQPLFDGFSTTNQVGAAEQNSKAANYDLMSSKNEIILRAIDAYLNVSRDRQVLNLSIKNVDNHRSILKDMQAKSEGGSGNNADVLQTRSRYALAAEQNVRLASALKNSEADFYEAIGRAPGTLESVIAPNIQISDSFEDVLDIATKNNAKLNATKYKFESAKFSQKQTKSVYFPSFSLDAEMNRERHTSGQRGFRGDSSVLLTMNYNLYAGGGDEARERAAMEKEQQARLKHDAQLRLTREQTIVAYNDFISKKDEVPLLQERASAAAGVAEAYKVQFSIGKRTLLDVLDTENELFQARVALMRGEFDIIRKHYQLLSQMGLAGQSFKIPDLEH